MRYCTHNATHTTGCWFLDCFGVVSALVSISQGAGIATETMWLLIAGFLGLLTGSFIPTAGAAL